MLSRTLQDGNMTNEFELKDKHHKGTKYTIGLLFVIVLLYVITVGDFYCAQEISRSRTWLGTENIESMQVMQ
ncbi:hypothetical protein X798_02961 [Onchocerca flexuosa]|uniref:Uncharacterized protein n=1 Tax=Onchocerca flexuosa TaxID=387005 RepID=A0A238BZG1_9BILA|nr:hypothetical protein X798_02961 [Onchocerca flexuosa]